MSFKFDNKSNSDLSVLLKEIEMEHIQLQDKIKKEINKLEKLEVDYKKINTILEVRLR